MDHRLGRFLVAAFLVVGGGAFGSGSAFADHDDTPAFCRTGEGHPVFGPRWCVDKGFGLGGRRDFHGFFAPFPGAYDPDRWKEAEKRAREREREYWKRQRENEREWAKHRRELERESRKHLEELRHEEWKHRRELERDARGDRRVRPRPPHLLEGWVHSRALGPQSRGAVEEIERQRRIIDEARAREDWAAYERY